MKKFLLAFLISLSFASLNCCGNFSDLFESNLSDSQIFEKARYNVVKVFSNGDIINIVEPNITPESRENIGSGFFIDSSGYILTAYHLVFGASSIYVQIPEISKEKFKAEVALIYPYKNFAIIKISEKGLQAFKGVKNFKFADSDNLSLNQEIVILGYPEKKYYLVDFYTKITNFSSIDDTIFLNFKSYTDIGYLGAPVMNLKGELIGLLALSGDIVPLNNLKNLINNLLSKKSDKKYIKNCFWGFLYTTLTEDSAKFLNNPTDGGIFITQIFPGSIFEKYGIKKGDLLYKVDNKIINSDGMLNLGNHDSVITFYDYLNRQDLGSTLDFVLYRQGEKLEIRVSSEELYFDGINYYFHELENFDYEIIGGMILTPLSQNYLELLKEELYHMARDGNVVALPELLKYSLPDKLCQPKIFISQLYQDSVIANTRALKVGQVIEKVNGIKVRTLSDFRKSFLESKKTGYLAIETEGGFFAAIKISDILEQEDSLANRYFYKKSNLLKDIE